MMFVREEKQKGNQKKERCDEKDDIQNDTNIDIHSSTADFRFI